MRIPQNLTPEYVNKHIKTVHLEDGGTIYSYEDKDGGIQSAVYHLMEGVTLIYKDVWREQFISNWRHTPHDALIIEYCKEGKLECEVDEDYLYHSPGDLIIFRTDYNVRKLSYPIKNYHSIAVCIDLEKFSPNLSVLLEQIHMNVDTLLKTYRLDQQYFCVLKENEKLQVLFEEICSAPRHLKNIYWQIKVFELLLLLVSSTKIDDCPKQRISKAQAEVAKAVHRYLTEHLYERFTIEELAERFAVSTTSLKVSFRTVYGLSVKRFDREQKMHAAALMLKETNRKVGDIASVFGYANTSKFSAMFKSVIGKTPLEYREEIGNQIIGEENQNSLSE